MLQIANQLKILNRAASTRCSGDDKEKLSMKICSEYASDFCHDRKSTLRFAKGDGGGTDSLDRAQMDKVGFDPPKCKFKLLCCCRISKPISTSFHGFSEIESFTFS